MSKQGRFRRMIAYLNRIKWVVLALAVTGILTMALTFKCREQPLWGVVFHLGEALLIVAFLGTVIEVFEISDFTRERLEEVLAPALSEAVGKATVESYLETRSNSDLDRLLKKCTKERYAGGLSPEHYVWEDFYTNTVCEILKLIGKPYRQDLVEQVNLAFVMIQEVLSEEGIAAGGSEDKVIRYDIVRTYDLVAPSREQDVSYPVTILLKSKRIPSLPPEKHVKLSLRVDETTIDVSPNVLYEISADGVDVSMKLDYKLTFRGRARLEFKMRTYESTLTSLRAVRMVDLTKGMQVHFSADRAMKLEARIYGRAGLEPQILQSSVTINHPDWVLPNQGYVISWVFA